MPSKPTNLQQFRITPALQQALRAYCERTGVNMSEAIRAAVVEYLEKRPAPARPPAIE